MDIKEEKGTEISVIVPAYNIEDYLENCIESLIQTTMFPQMEVLLINDGSEDRSRVIGEGYASQYSNIFCYSFENGGISRARNEGMKLAKGRYLFFLDGDDTVTKNYIENLYKKALETDCDVVYAGFTFIREDGSEIELKTEILKCLQDIRTGTDYIEMRMNLQDTQNQVWCALYKREFLVDNDLYFHDEVRLYEDILFTNEVMVKATKVTSIMDYGYRYQYRKGSLVSERKLIRDCSALLDIAEILVEKRKAYTPCEMHAMGRVLFYVLTMYAYSWGLIVYKNKSIDPEQRKNLKSRLMRIAPWDYLRMARTTRREKLKYLLFTQTSHTNKVC